MRGTGTHKRNAQISPVAKRNNFGKPKLSRIFDAPHAMVGIAEVMEAGDVEYGRGNFRKGLPWTQVVDSMLRHLSAFQNGEDLDPKSGKPHTDHILCNAMFLAQYFREGKGEDDRIQGLDE